LFGILKNKISNKDLYFFYSELVTQNIFSVAYETTPK